MIKRSLTFLLISLIFVPCSYGQDVWEVYANGDKINDITFEGEFVWTATEGGAFRWDKINGVYNRYTNLDGLPFIDVSTVYVASNGEIWFGTNGFGVAVFNGINWTVFDEQNSNLSYNEITCIVEDDSNNIWVGTKMGLNLYDGTWTEYNTTNTPNLGSNNIRSLAVDDSGSVWVGTSYGLSKYDGTNWYLWQTTEGLVSNDIYSVAIDTEGVWIATSGGISKFDGVSFENFTTASGLIDNYVVSIAVDSTDTVWACYDQNYGITKYDGTTWVNYDTSNTGLPCNKVSSIGVDGDGNIWFGTEKGLTKFDKINWTGYQVNGFTGKCVTAIVQDNNNNMWFGTMESGVFKFDGTNWTNYDTTNSDLSYNNISDIAIHPDGSIWIATSANGIDRFDGTNWTHYKTEDGLASNVIHCLYINIYGDIWAGTDMGVSQFTNSEWFYCDYPMLPSDNILSITGNDRGEIFIGTTSGLYIDSYTGPKVFNLPPEYGVNSIDDLTFDLKGNLIVAHYGGGGTVFKFDRKNWTVILPVDAKNVVVDNVGFIWAANDMGVHMYDKRNLKHYTMSEGLLNDDVRVLFIDNEGNKWIGTTNGINKLITPAPVLMFIQDAFEEPGENVTVQVDAVTSFTDKQIIGFDIKIAYNPEVLNCTGYNISETQIGELLNFTISDTIVPGTLKVSGANINPLSGSGNFMKINFQINPNTKTGDTSNIIFTQLTFNEDSSLSTYENGRVIVRPFYGDVSGNKEITSLDASMVLQYVVEKITLDSIQLLRADVVNFNGVTAFDASFILDVSAGLRDNFPVEEILFYKGKKQPEEKPLPVISKRTSNKNNYTD
ncbi:hypothetical protein DRQ09_08770, partial [candidate division KSB1 bacterium]